MPKLPRPFIISVIALALTTSLVFIVKSLFFNKPDLEDYTSQNLLKGVESETAAVFLYTDDFNTRYVVTSPRKFTTAIASINNDPNFITILNFHKEGICYIEKTTNLYTDSFLYFSLLEEDLIGEDNYYIACPIFINKNLVGYMSEIFFFNTKGVIIEVNKMVYFTKIVEDNLKELI